MTQLLVKEKQIVTPGEIMAEGIDYLPGFGTYRAGDNIRAKKLGIVNINGKVLKLIPLSGRYSPKVNDAIIGRVIDITLNGWRIETNSAYSCLLSMRDGTTDYVQKGADLTKYYGLGDYVGVKIINVTTQKLIDVTAKGPGLGKLREGRILKVSPSKVPRIIGKGGSMLSVLKSTTGCQLMVGQNGMIWLKGEPKKEIVLVEAIKFIEKNAHKTGLTEQVNRFLSERVR